MSTADPTAVHFGHAHDLPRVDAGRVPRVIDRMKAIVGPDGVLTAPADLLVYECDGYTIEKNKPDVVVFPTTTEQVVADRQGLQRARTCRSCRAGPAPAWPAAACRSAAAS